MDLFHSADVNLLPFDGIATYSPSFLNSQEAGKYFETLIQSIPWQNDEVVVFGKKHITRRKTAWYGDKPYNYTYSSVSREALPWTNALIELKSLIEQETNDRFNSCLLNLYHDGEDGMGWHADNEKTLVPDASIASLSLGAQRKFAFKHRESGRKVELQLENGSLLLMKGEIQRFWLHSLLKTKKSNTPRINLTFRKFRDES